MPTPNIPPGGASGGTASTWDDISVLLTLARV